MCIVRRAVGVAVASAALIALLWCSAAVEARDVVMTSFDGTPIAAHFYPAVGLDPGELAPSVLVPWLGDGRRHFPGREPRRPDRHVESPYSSYGGGIAPLEVTRECLRATT
jgi:hypothetical protein